MSCFDPSRNALGTKLVMVRDRRSPEKPGVEATYLLLDADSAKPRLTIAANYFTDLRTAATSALATKYLAREDATTLAIFGTGRLARAHLHVLPLVRKFRRILICGRDPGRTSAFVQEIAKSDVESSALVEGADPKRCASEADVLCTCTNSGSPLFEGQHLRPGTHLNLLGAFQPHTREVDTNTIRGSRIVVETYATLSEAGDLAIPLQEGAIAGSQIFADLHELTSGKKPGRQNREEITVFKSVGCALEDLATAELLLGSAEKQE